MIMKHLVVIFLSMLTLAACSDDNNYVIEGALYGGTSFEGETIYLVPFVNATEEDVDSATIHNGRFRFEGSIDGNEMCILRMRPMMKLFIKELIFVKEPGHISTLLSKTSYAKGTPLNDSLQAWNQYKLGIDSVSIAINKAVKRAADDEELLKKLQLKSDSLRLAFDKHNRQVVENNDNAFGRYIEKFAKFSK